MKKESFLMRWRERRKTREVLACAQACHEEYDIVKKTDLVLDGAEVWEPSFSDGVVRYIGLPVYVLVKEGQMWVCDGEQGLEINRLLYPSCDGEEDGE